MFPTEYHRAADTRFFRNPGLLPTSGVAVLLRAPRMLDPSGWLPPIPDWESSTEIWLEPPLLVSYLADSLRNEYTVQFVVYSEFYLCFFAARVHTVRVERLFVRVHATVLRHLAALYMYKLMEEPDSEAEFSMYGNTRPAVENVSWDVAFQDIVRGDADSGHALQVAVMVVVPTEYGVLNRHACVDFEWALNPDTWLSMAQVPPTHVGVWRRSRWNNYQGASAVADDRGSRARSLSPQRARSRSLSPLCGFDVTWPTRYFSSAAVALFGSPRVREVRHRAPRGAALAAEAMAWVEPVTSLRRAVERADGRGVESVLSINGQAVDRSMDGLLNYERLS